MWSCEICKVYEIDIGIATNISLAPVGENFVDLLNHLELASSSVNRLTEP